MYTIYRSSPDESDTVYTDGCCISEDVVEDATWSGCQGRRKGRTAHSYADRRRSHQATFVTADWEWVVSGILSESSATREGIVLNNDTKKWEVSIYPTYLP